MAAPPRRRPRFATRHGARLLPRKTLGDEPWEEEAPRAETREALFSALENPTPIPAERAGLEGAAAPGFAAVGERVGAGEVVAGW